MGCGIEPRKIRHRRGRGFSFARRQHVRHQLCEVPTPCRGQRPHHVQKDRIGSSEVSGLTATALPLWPASGRRGAVADDARIAHCWGERSGAGSSGAGGAKGRDQGECGPAKHVPATEPAKRVTAAGPHTEGLCRHTHKVGLVREFRPHGSGRGARDETHVPTRYMRQASWCDPAGARPVQVRGTPLFLAHRRVYYWRNSVYQSGSSNSH